MEMEREREGDGRRTGRGWGDAVVVAWARSRGGGGGGRVRVGESERKEMGRAGQNLTRLVAPARLVRQSCCARVAGATGRGPRYAIPASAKHDCHCGSACRAIACGVTAWYSRARRAGAAKRSYL